MIESQRGTTMTDVRAITVRQPWASLTANGRKTIEWRTGRWPRWTGTVLIHAAATWAPGWKGRWFTPADLEGRDGAILDGIGIAGDLGEDVNGSDYYKLDQWASRRVPTGAVIAVGRIVMVLPVYDALTITDYGLAEPWEPHFTVNEFAQRLTEWHANPEDFAEPDWLETPRSDQLAYSGGYAVPGNVGLCLADVVRLDRPVPAKGRLGLWRPDPDLIAECMEQTR